MFRSLLRSVLALIIVTAAAPVWAAEKPAPTAPSAAVAEAWAKEARSAGSASGNSSTALKALYASYGALGTLDMVSTIKARNAGATEVNPLMNSGYGQATATKAIFAAATITAVKMLEKKNKKAALVTMVALNAATAAVVVKNYSNARQR
jgi:hypothetical protein